MAQLDHLSDSKLEANIKLQISDKIWSGVQIKLQGVDTVTEIAYQ